MTYHTIWNGAGASWQPAGDYRLDWDLTGADGAASLASASGGDAVGVTVTTPTNGQCDAFSLKNGQLYSNDVTQPTISEIAFDQPVTDVNFQLIDVDQGCNWDDEVTILAYDPDGNLVDVDFDAISGAQSVSGNAIEGEGELCDTGITVSVAGPIVKLVIVHDNGDDAHESGHISVTDLGFNCMPAPEGDGIVEGTEGDDLIDLAYTGDPHGDMVDAGDALLPGEVGDDDIILAKDGNDTVQAGDGDDEIYAGSGDDVVEGGAGNDVIHGDNGGAPAETEIRESFNWAEASDAQLDASFTQDTGSVDVTYTRTEDAYTHYSQHGSETVNGDGIDTGDETLDEDSALYSETGGYCGAGTFQWDFSQTVENVEFNVNDLDGDGVVTIRAYDADGNEIPVTLEAGAGITLLEGGGAQGPNVADSNGGYAQSDSDAYNVQVTIAGPVAKIVLEHEQDGSHNSGINVTDIFFDVIVPGEACEAGNDVIDGGAGDDLIYGEAGDDTIAGGEGADVIYGDTGGATAPMPPQQITLDFNDLAAGDLVSDQYAGVTISSGDSQHPAMIFDSANPTGDDTDLATTNLGKVLILSGDGDSSDPDDHAGSGTISFDFDGVVSVQGLTLLDMDNGVGSLTFYDAAGNQIEVMDLPETRDGDQTEMNFNVADVARMDVWLAGSGAIDNLVYTTGGAPAEVCEPGNDALFGGDGDDAIYGEGGEDYLEGGAGADTLSGGDDRDWFGGGTAGDQVDGGDGGDDWDTLDLSNEGPLRVINQTVDPDGNSTSGTVQFLDDEGNVTGEMTFTEIEQLILPENQGPDAEDDTAIVDEDDSVVIDVLANDSDPEGDPLTIDSVTDGAHGTVTINPDGTVTYTPEADYNGPDSFTYTVSDGNGGTETATVNIDVLPVNDAPDALDDTANVNEDDSVVIDVLTNDSDPDGDPLTIDSVTDGAHGKVTINPDGTVTYTPDADYTGPDSFTYTVTDGNGGFDTATVELDVAAVNEGPDAVDDTAATVIDTTVTIDVLDNDSDPDGDPLTVIDATSPDGTVDFSTGTAIDFTPAPGFDGEATISYTISDGQGGTDTAEVVVMVRDGVVEGTEAGDLIDEDYEGDPEGDMVDAGDAVLPGEVGDDDIIEAGAGDDTVYAGLGDDEVTGGDGSDVVYGGQGNDVIDTSGSAPASDYGADLPGTLYDVPEDADKTNDLDFVDGGDGDDIIATGDDADTILGGTGEDQIDGGLDDDIIDAGADDDLVIGGHGSDDIEGGAGNDTLWGGMGDGTDILNIEDEDDPAWGIDDPRPDNGMDTLHGGEGDDVIYGQDDDDVLYGDAGNDKLDGGIDDDALYGGEGDDTLTGGTGEDYLDGGAGNDQMAGGDDRDWFANVNAGDTVDGNEGGDDWDTLDLTGSAAPGGSLSVTYTTPDQETGFVTYKDEDGNDLGTLDFYNIEKVVPCFTPGTLIATPKGEVPVESLKAGDRVITRDNGIQEIKWAGSKPIGFKDLAKAPHLAPIHIRAGALGNGLPERDMMLSPNHRVLVANDRTSLYFDEREVLAAAKHLVDSKGVQVVEPIEVTYVHFMCENHEVVLSDGAWTESFQPGDYSLNGIGNAQRQELFELFPELETEEGLEDYAAARRILKKHEAQMLLRN